MKAIKYDCSKEETAEEITARAFITSFVSAANSNGDKATSVNRIHNIEVMNRVLAQRDRIKRTAKKRKPIKASAGDITYAQYQDGYYERKERGK